MASSQKELPDFVKIFHGLSMSDAKNAQTYATAILKLQQSAKEFKDPIAKQKALQIRFANVEARLQGELSAMETSILSAIHVIVPPSNRSRASASASASSGLSSEHWSQTGEDGGLVLGCITAAMDGFQNVMTILEGFKPTEQKKIKVHLNLNALRKKLSGIEAEIYRADMDVESVEDLDAKLETIHALVKKSQAQLTGLVTVLYPNPKPKTTLRSQKGGNCGCAAGASPSILTPPPALSH